MIKKIIIGILSIYVAVGIWFNATYNWPPPVEPVTFKTYAVNLNEMDSDMLQSWEREARSIKGVTALTLNSQSEIMAVSVKANNQLDQFLANSLEDNSKLKIEEIVLEGNQSGGCPYHKTLDKIAFLFKWPYISESY